MAWYWYWAGCGRRPPKDASTADVDESLLAALPELTYCRHFFCKAWGMVLGRARGMALVILS